MSEIKNTPGVPGGPGSIDETKREEVQNPERGARFRKIARRMREKKLEEMANLQGGGPGSASEALLDAIRRKTQIQGQPGSVTTNPFAPTGPGPHTTDPTTAGPSLLGLFGGGKLQPAATNQPAAPVFRPTFKGGVANTNTATGSASPLNPMYFATEETTAWLILQKLPELGFPGAEPFLKNSGSNGGPFVANQQELWIRLADGTEINAGMLADYYVRNPEDKFPGLADNYLKQIISGEIQGQAGKART
jgi:hypothetical protein